MSEKYDHIEKSTESSVLPFAPVSLADKPTVDKYMSRYGQSSCQHSFTALFTLREKYGSEICERDGFLHTLRSGLCTENERVYLAPMGGGDLKAAYQTILDDAGAHGCKAVFQPVTKEQAAFLKENFPGRFDYTELRDYAEYIYSSEALSAMKGKHYADKRGKVNKLLRTYGSRLEVKPLDSDCISDVWELEQKWLRENTENNDAAALTREMRTIRLQLDSFELLELRGIGIYVDGKMSAFAYGAPLNSSCFDGLIAKADQSIPNLYKLLYREISRMCAQTYPHFNWEEDVGLPGLRSTKMEYRPIVLMRKYLVRERGKLSVAPEDGDIPVISLAGIAPREKMIPGSLTELGKNII